MDLCEKKRSSQGANYRREDLLGKKEERRRAKVNKRQIREGVKIPSTAPFPNRAWHLHLPHPPSPPSAAAMARPAWWCAPVAIHPLISIHHSTITLHHQHPHHHSAPSIHHLQPPTHLARPTKQPVWCPA
ncbi:hypothetical protein VPH35_006593 [Triticum aestivum]